MNPQDNERHKQSQKKHRLAGSQQKFHSGFAALENLNNVTFERMLGRRQANLLLLTRKLPLQAFAQRATQSRDLSFVERYRIQPDIIDKKFPFLIKPRLLNGGRQLEIRIEIAEKPAIKSKAKDSDKELVGIPKLDNLTLELPPNYQVKNTNGHHDRGELQVTWERQGISLHQPLSLFVEFEQPINVALPQSTTNGHYTNGHQVHNPFSASPPGSPSGQALSLGQGICLHGSYKLTIEDWTISQMHVAQDVTAPQSKSRLVRMANGLRVTDQEGKSLAWMKPTVKHKTVFEGEIHLNTAHLASQEMKTLSTISDHQQNVEGKETFPVAPSYHVVNAIGNLLTEQGVFIKHVFEIAGDVLEASNTRDRYWEIRGKCYLSDTLQPVDLHLIVSGEDLRGMRSHSQGVLNYDLTLRSPIRTGDQQKQAELQSRYNQFNTDIKNAIYFGRQVIYRNQRATAWRIEQQFEDRLRRRFPDIQEVMVILVDRPDVQGYIFYTSDDPDFRVPSTLQWPAIVQQSLPDDKWDLLRRMEWRN